MAKDKKADRNTEAFGKGKTSGVRIMSLLLLLLLLVVLVVV